MAEQLMRAQLKGSTASINSTAGYKGVLVLNTDTNHLHILTGEAGSNIELANKTDIPEEVDISGKADKTYVDQQLANKQPIGDYATNTELTEGLATKLGKSENAVSATKATQDASGNVITTTYATKSELSSGLAGKQPTGDYATNTALTQGLATKVDSTTYSSDKSTFLTKTDASNTYLNKTAKAESAKIADSATNATTAITATNNILKSGARGSLAGSETVSVLSGNQTITKNSADTIVMNTSGAVTLTFTPAGTNDCAIKVIALTATGETTLNISGVVWANAGEAPTWGTSGKHLVLVAHFIGGRIILNVFDNDEG